MQQKYTLSKKLLLLSIVLVSGLSLRAQTIWNEVVESNVSTSSERYIIPSSYQTYALDLEEALSQLMQAPKEFSVAVRNSSTTINLPMPGGEMQEFAIVSSSIMPTSLAAKYPSIHSFLGQGLDDGTATARITISNNGFHAMIVSSSGTSYIDPYSINNASYCISYFKEDFYATNQKVRDSECVINNAQANAKSMAIGQSGDVLRVYRAAVACTGEYAQFHANQSGDAADIAALAAIVTTLDRVNLVFDREASVRLNLVANNNLIVYTNSTTDPYSNSNAGAILGENQENIDDLIGNGNYDIGHVFSTGAGGLASPGLCNNTFKAKGVTGTNAPIGDPFDIDYVAHEMGHQFGANHTFNGDSGNGNCGGGNRNPSTAYEPGSGTTILAYAGICEVNNVQQNSDDYYHTASFDEITGNIDNNDCAEQIETGNAIPVSNANPTGVNFTIPMNTPFELTGVGTDPNAADVLTYCWEQFDLGDVADDLTNASGNAPLFRSWSPIESPTRVFPRMSDIVAGTSTSAENLPHYARDMKFRLTVRDNNAGGGGVSYDQIQLSVTDEADAFSVNDINEDWEYGSTYSVEWDVANTDVAPVSCDVVDILLSTDNGLTFEVLVSDVSNNGLVLIICPNLISNQAIIKVKGNDNIFFNISNTFNIIEPTEPNFSITVNPEELSICSGEMAIFDIEVDPILDFATPVTLSIADIPDGIIVTFVPENVSPGDNSILTISSPFPIPAGVYPFQITATAGDIEHLQIVSITIFEGIPETVALTFPTAALVDVSLTPSFTWSTSDNADSYTLQIATDAEFVNIVHTLTDIENASYSLGALLDAETEYFWNVMSNSPCGDSEFSETLSFTTGEESITEIPGCTDVTAFNYDPTATVDDDSCVPVTFGCTNPVADNFNETANTDNGSCMISGCTNPDALNYDEEATNEDGSCMIEGCTDPAASNYNPIANIEDNSCIAFIDGCTDSEAYNYNPSANNEDGSCDYTSLVIIQWEVLEGSNFHFWAIINDIPTVNTMFWNMGDGTTYGGLFEPNHYYEENGSYEVSLTVSTIAGSFIAYATVEVTGIIPGCTDITAYNYNPEAILDDGSCEAPIFGCTNSDAINYNTLANSDDGSCIGVVYGCTDATAMNYNEEANSNDGSCIAYVYGCTDVDALNYNELANTEDQSCLYPIPTEPNWDVEITSNNHIVLIPSTANITINDSPIEVGDYIGAFYLAADQEYYCAGKMQYTGITNTLTVYGSDPGMFNGFEVGEELIWKTWKASLNEVRLALADYDATMPNLGNYITDGISGITALSNTMSQSVEMMEGWNLISTYIIPDYPSMGDVFAPVVEDLFLAKDEIGSVYWPAYNLNNIGDHTTGKAYKVKMNADAVLQVRGANAIPTEHTLLLNEGWSYLGYLRKQAADISIVMESIAQDILLIKDGIGNVYWPEFNVNTIGNMEPGKGYQVRMVATREFNFPGNDVVLPQLRTSSKLINKHFTTPKAKEMSMNIALPIHLLNEFVVGDEIAVKNSNNEVLATSVFNKQTLALTIWINEEDLNTNFSLFHWSSKTNNEVEFNFETSSAVLQNNAVVVVQSISKFNSVNSVTVFPNPSSEKATVEVYLSNEALTCISLYNTLGERVLVIENTVLSKGLSNISFNVSNLTTGIYFMKINSATYSEVQKFQVH
jgi:hypothetical protein